MPKKVTNTIEVPFPCPAVSGTIPINWLRPTNSLLWSQNLGLIFWDGSYTPFGRVIEGMDVVDAINNVPVGDGDWPWQNIYIIKAEVL